MDKPPSGDASPVRSRARQDRPADTPSKVHLRALLLALLLWAAWGAAFALYRSPERVSVAVGQASPRDIKARRQVSYISEVKTEEARGLAAAQVRDVFTSPDMTLAMRQVEALEEITAYITALRYDPYASREQKLELLRDIPGLALSPATLAKIPELDDDAWDGVTRESLRVLDLLMREEIRASDLAEARRRVERLTSRSLTEQQQELVVPLVQQLLVSNSLLDVAETAAQRAAARAAVEPVRWNIQPGESILRGGEIVSDLAYEKLQVSGLLDTKLTWQELTGTLLLALILVVMLALYVAKFDPLLIWRPRRELLLCLALAGVGLGARFLVPGHTLLPYLLPGASAAMVVAIFLDVHLGVLVAVVTAVLVGYNADGSLGLAVYTLVGSVVGAVALARAEQIGAFVRAGLYVLMANLVTVVAFQLTNQQLDTLGLVQLLGVGFLNAALSAILAFVAYAFTGRLFGVTTALQLLELARPTHPLFRQLLIKAPGTYHHSILISNMAERAAEAIGADALLARVGAYYHDIGKTTRPYFFSENQTDGVNPHDKLDPRTSAEIIIAHASDGLELAERYRLPEKVKAFVAEHHGTTLAAYFYRRAVQLADGQEVDEKDFRYPGPRPQSRESAIVMLADSVEAWSRANRPATQAEMERVIRQVMSDRLVSGQLDESDLTLRDLDRIRESFISVLQGIYHPRIQYPERVTRHNGRGAKTASS